MKHFSSAYAHAIPQVHRRHRFSVVALGVSVLGLSVYASAQAPQSAPAATAPQSVVTATPAPDLIIRDAVVGKGDGAKPGDTLSVHYTGWLHDPLVADGKGKRFDSSLDRDKRYDVVLGVSRVIRGWTMGLEGMKVGGKRTLIIPSQLGYGDRGRGPTIPPGATLLFEVELFALTPGTPPAVTPATPAVPAPSPTSAPSTPTTPTTPTK